MRGAYMEQERSRAASMGYEDPIHNDYEASSRCYSDVTDTILKAVVEKGANLVIASHNEASIRHTVQRYVLLFVVTKL